MNSKFKPPKEEVGEADDIFVAHSADFGFKTSKMRERLKTAA